MSNVVNARIFKGQMPDLGGGRRHNKLPPVPLYHVRCDCGYASGHFTRASAERDLDEHAQRESGSRAWAYREPMSVGHIDKAVQLTIERPGVRDTEQEHER